MADKTLQLTIVVNGISAIPAAMQQASAAVQAMVGSLTGPASGSAAAAAITTAQVEDDLASGLSRSSSLSSLHPALGEPPIGEAQQQQLMSARAEQVAGMLARLQQLPWRRVDVCFLGATWGFAHNNIQVTRRLLNFQGVQVPVHLAQQLADMEARLQRGEEEGRAGGGCSVGG